VVWQSTTGSGIHRRFRRGRISGSAGTRGCWFLLNCGPSRAEMHASPDLGNTITFDSPATISYRVGSSGTTYTFQTRSPTGRTRGSSPSSTATTTTSILVVCQLWASNGGDSCGSVRVSAFGTVPRGAERILRAQAGVPVPGAEATISSRTAFEILIWTGFPCWATR